MVHTHPSTPEQRAQWSAEMLAHPTQYGLITRLSREHNISRPTLYAWRQRAQQPCLPPLSQPLHLMPLLSRSNAKS